MIRPFTCVCVLLAAGAGLYTYQAKHQAELLDREIARVLKKADDARQRAGTLRAEYALLNEPQRLKDLAAVYLKDLRDTTPGQFAKLAELDRRLPPIGAVAAAAPPLTEPPDVKPDVKSDPASHGANPPAAKPVNPVVAKATPALPARPTQVGQAPLGAPVVATSLPSAAAARARPLVQKTAVAVARPPRADAFVTPVSTPSENLARLIAAAPSVGRSGLGGVTASALGMARASSEATLYPAALPSR